MAKTMKEKGRKKEKKMLRNRLGIRLVSLIIAIVMVLGNSAEVWALRPPSIVESSKKNNRKSPFEGPGTPHIEQGPDLIPRAIRQDRREEEVRFDAYADTLYRLERQIRLARGEALQPFINRLMELSDQIKVPEETDELSQLPLAQQSEKLRSQIRLFEKRFREAHQARDDPKLTELNKEVLKLLNRRLKIHFRLAVAWLEVAKSDRRKLIAAINTLRGARSTSKRTSLEYGWQRRRETKRELIEKIRTVGYYGIPIETFLYKDLDIKVYAPDEEHPQGRVTVRQQRWVTVILPDGTKLKEKQWRDVPYEDWPAALRSQIHTLANQEVDYETVLHYLGDLEYWQERLPEYRKKIPEYIHQQIEESLVNTLLWAKRGRVDGKRLGSENLEFALAKLKEGDIDAVLKELARATENLKSRQQEIEDIRKDVNRRLESIYLHIRNSDMKEKLTLVKEKLNQDALEEALNLASELYDNYFIVEVEEGGYKYLRGKITAISSAIVNLKELTQQGKSISDELTRRKQSHNAMQSRIKIFRIERDRLQKREKSGLLDEEGIARLRELKSIISSLEKQMGNNQTAIGELNTKLLITQRRYLNSSDKLREDIDLVLKVIERQIESKVQSKPIESANSQTESKDLHRAKPGNTESVREADRLTRLQSDIIAKALNIPEPAEVTAVLSAENTIYAADAGEVFQEYVNKISNLESIKKEDIKGRALIVGPDFFRSGGVTNALRAVAELSKTVKIAVYGENAQKLKILAGNQDIVIAPTLNAVLAELENKYGISPKDTLLLHSSQEALDEGAINVKQMVMPEGIPATLALGKALKELLGESVTPAFEELLNDIVTEGVIEQRSLNENREALLAMLEEGQEFRFSEDLKTTEKVAKDTEVVRAKETIKEFMNKHI